MHQDTFWNRGKLRGNSAISHCGLPWETGDEKVSSSPSARTLVPRLYRAFPLTWLAAMQIYWNRRKCLHKKRLQFPQNWFGTPTWPPIHCFDTKVAAVTSCENTLWQCQLCKVMRLCDKFYNWMKRAEIQFAKLSNTPQFMKGKPNITKIKLPYFNFRCFTEVARLF